MKQSLEKEMPREPVCADDVEFTGIYYINIDAIQNMLQKYNLKANIKTKKTIFSKTNETGWLYATEKK